MAPLELCTVRKLNSDLGRSLVAAAGFFFLITTPDVEIGFPYDLVSSLVLLITGRLITGADWFKPRSVVGAIAGSAATRDWWVAGGSRCDWLLLSTLIMVVT